MKPVLVPFRGENGASIFINVVHILTLHADTALDPAGIADQQTGRTRLIPVTIVYLADGKARTVYQTIDSVQATIEKAIRVL